MLQKLSRYIKLNNLFNSWDPNSGWVVYSFATNTVISLSFITLLITQCSDQNCCVSSWMDNIKIPSSSSPISYAFLKNKWIPIVSIYIHIEGILPKGPYLPCVSMASRTLLAGYPRYTLLDWMDLDVNSGRIWYLIMLTMTASSIFEFTLLTQLPWITDWWPYLLRTSQYRWISARLQDCGNSSALTVGLPQSCTKPPIPAYRWLCVTPWQLQCVVLQ